MMSLRTKIGTGVRIGLLGAALLAAGASPAVAGGLHGSHSSMVHQHHVAVKEDYTFTRNEAQLKHLVELDALVPVVPNGDFTLADVSYPYARPEVKDLVERLAWQYHDSIGSPLVVTSLTRPRSDQPWNASPLSVHPAGMAVDLRIPADASALKWLENKLLSMEKAGVLDVTREHHPPHLHIAVFPDAYRKYAAREDSLHPRPVRVAAVPATATDSGLAGQGDTAAVALASTIPGTSTLPLVVLVAFDALLAAGILLAVRRGAQKTD